VFACSKKKSYSPNGTAPSIYDKYLIKPNPLNKLKFVSPQPPMQSGQGAVKSQTFPTIYQNYQKFAALILHRSQIVSNLLNRIPKRRNSLGKRDIE